ncbi:MAG TPA: ATP-binding protein [Thermodesulfovibrionales bacterium]|nr:ATP-binding protein [Thermodesulfovibrionales bacterium]
MSRSIFRRILWLYALVMLLAVVFVELYITSAVRGSYIDNLKTALSGQIKLISHNVTFSQADLDPLCRRLKGEIGARVTIIAPDGKVLGDSDSTSSLMDNHAHRPEIEQSVLLGSGFSIRHSNTLKYDLLYTAQKFEHNDKVEGFIRLSVPLKEVDVAVNRLRVNLILVVIMILLATWVFSALQTNHLRRLLRQVMDFSRALARGEIDKKLFLPGTSEFDEIAANLNSMSAELKDIIAESEEEKRRLNEILKSIPDALLIIDSKGIIHLSSSASKEFFGDGPLTGRHFMEVVRNGEFSDLVDSVKGSLLSGIAEFRVDYPDERYLIVRVSPLLYGEKDLSGLVAVFHDITQLRKLEQVRKDFIANVSHEIKTPITAIKGFADTLLECALDDRENAIRFLQTIKSNSERINSLVDDLMIISKIELGVIRVEKSEIDVEDIAGSVVLLLGDKAAEKKLYLRTHINPACRRLSADKDRLTQILTNLVDNAIKFTETGGVTLGIDEEDGKAFLFVEDTGIGVSKEHLPRLGERFYRVDPARSRKLGGTGLGLAIVKHLVKAHGWDMHIESTLGKGTKVKIFTTPKEIK